jgi:hypothetical protein
MTKLSVQEQAIQGLFAQYRARRDVVWVRASGSSMSPIINDKSWLLIAFGELPIKRGEIILFKLNTRLIAHRVVAWQGDAIVAKGDGEYYCDALVSPQNVLGVVRAIRATARAQASSFACDGVAAEWCGWWSGVLGRSAAWLRRVAQQFPIPAQRMMLKLSTALMRVASLVIFAPIAWLVHHSIQW